MLVVSPSDVELLGLQYCGIPRINNLKPKGRLLAFKAHYGTGPLELSQIWDDLNDKGIVTEAESTEDEFKYYRIANFVLWSYPKNSQILASRFGLREREVQGKSLWKLVRKIAQLKPHKIKWDVRLHETEDDFVYSIDCVDFRCWEKQHPDFPIDKKMYSKKFAHAAFKYEIAISVWESRVMWVAGPFMPSVHDLKVFRRSGLKDKVTALADVMGVADRGYNTSKPGEVGLFSTPNEADSKRLKNFKTRIRLRHETFNGRLKHFNILSDTFRGTMELHGHVVNAVCVILQYQMDNGARLYDV